MIAKILVSLSCLLLSFQPGLGPGQSVAGTTWARTLTYVMRGEVRLLLFWVGRDNVGGGRISLARGTEQADGLAWEEVEVLFGSHPERVPGKVNMWGYGKERSRWQPNQGGTPALVKSVFEGFMRPEGDYSTNMQDYQKAHKAQDSFVYQSVRSEVNDKMAATEIRFFVEKEDFNYRAPEGMIRRYQQSLSATAPEIRRELARQAANYDIPAGFLTATQSLVAAISDQAARKPTGWTALRPAVRYAFHAKPYRLSVRRIAAVQNFPTSAAGTSGTGIQNVAEVDFRIENLKEGLTYDFTLWFALSGPMQGLPLRIVYQPKWWLRLRLDLTGVVSHG
jgi:hypothetical protein